MLVDSYEAAISKINEAVAHTDINSTESEQEMGRHQRPKYPRIAFSRSLTVKFGMKLTCFHSHFKGPHDRTVSFGTNAPHSSIPTTQDHNHYVQLDRDSRGPTDDHTLLEIGRPSVASNHFLRD